MTPSLVHYWFVRTQLHRLLMHKLAEIEQRYVMGQATFGELLDAWSAVQ